MRFFNKSGPVNCEDHYCLNPLNRLDLEGIIDLIDQKKYFVMHAPRQTGKTSCLLALMKHLNDCGKYHCLYFNVELAQAAREDINQAIRGILGEMASRAKFDIKDSYLDQLWTDLWEKHGSNAFNEALTLWAVNTPKPLVLLIDEIDSLVGDTLISVLRQLRAGYDKRPKQFPQSIILCGVRDVRDYRMHHNKLKEIITGGSAFNIKDESLRLGDFTREDVEKLYACHTEETGQQFESEAIETVWYLTEGQPWLVNALGYEVCFKMKENRDRSKTITPEMVIQAKENIIQRRETHIDQLADKLSESRVRSVIEPLLTGTPEPGRMLDDDIQYVTDLGLIRRKPQLTISNAIYKEIIPRMLTETTQEVLALQTRSYIHPDGTLDMNKLLSEFQTFFREHSEHWVDRFDYKEAGPQLLIQAYLQRIVNSGGRVEREYGLGQKRVDLFVLWNHQQGVQKIVIELKIIHKSLKQTLQEGLEQTADYMDICGTEEGHLVIFDRDPEKKWEEKIFQKQETANGKFIRVWGM